MCVYPHETHGYHQNQLCVLKNDNKLSKNQESILHFYVHEVNESGIREITAEYLVSCNFCSILDQWQDDTPVGQSKR